MSGTGNSKRIAMRFQYPSDEKTTDAENYSSALESQCSDNDDINRIMRLLNGQSVKRRTTLIWVSPAS